MFNSPLVIKFSVFVDKVRTGEKRQTIRFWEDKEYPKVGQAVSLLDVAGDELGVGRCSEVKEVRLWSDSQSIEIDGYMQLESEIDQLAADDGFDCVADFWEFFEGQEGAEVGRVICWE